MSKKVALVTGITGQDGAYLAEYLLRKGYKVFGLKRRSSIFNTQRIDHLFPKTRGEKSDFSYAYSDLTDATSLIRIIEQAKPDEIYNLAAQSHVKVSFDTPEYTANTDGLGILRILEAVRILGLEKTTKIYQASTSELFGKVKEVPQNENTPFYPRSPYAAAKAYAYYITVNYREAYNMYACNGILFNHESPLRGETFVTRKITRAVANIALDFQDKLLLGNLNAKRDWGHAKDFIQAMYLMLQQEVPKDYVIATGETHSVKEFVERSFEVVGIKLAFEGTGVNEVGTIDDVDTTLFEERTGTKPNHLKKGQEIVAVDPFYFRPTEVDLLLGDASQARKDLGWEPKYTFRKLVEEMTISDIHLMKKEDYLKKGGYQTIPNIEDIM